MADVMEGLARRRCAVVLDLDHERGWVGRMAVYQKSFPVSTRGHCDVLDITAKVARIVSESKIDAGIVNVSGRGSTLAVTTLEFESGCVADLRRALEKIAPENSDYAHNARWGDDNGYAHLRSALIGTAKSFPLAGGKLAIGTWQQIVLCDFDERGREREITVTVVGSDAGRRLGNRSVSGRTGPTTGPTLASMA
jgi:secondary thiamine-phosphate synthase enzyme